MSALFMPKKLNVGFVKREDTYTKKLAYVIYYDEKNILRKEKSWNDWRDHSISNEEFDNEPIEGFVLNKHAGGKSYGWNDRYSYIRVYDPRGFEVEIKVDNLLYILEHCSCTKGKGIEGKLVYAWDGTELVLLPVGSQSYKDAKIYSDNLFNGEGIANKDLIVGYTYSTKSGIDLLYLGKFNVYGDYFNANFKGRRHLFLDVKLIDKIENKGFVNDAFYFEALSSVKGKLISVKDNTIHSDLNTCLKALEKSKCFISISQEYEKNILEINEVEELTKKSSKYFKKNRYLIKKKNVATEYIVTNIDIKDELITIFAIIGYMKPFSLVENISLDDLMEKYIIYTKN